MSLLLDARKKSQQASSAQGADDGLSVLELSLEELPYKASAKSDPQPVAGSPDATSPDNIARNAGKNLFNAKSASLARTGGINRNLLFSLGGTVLLLAAGAGYLWYIDSTSSQPPLPRVQIAAAPITAAPQKSLAVESTTPASAVTAQAAGALGNTPHVSQEKQKRPSTKLRTDFWPGTRNKPAPQSSGGISLKPQQTELPDTLIDNAYLAYRSGKLEEARQMYLEILGKDARNTDALLGLAAIAQQLGEDGFAAQYYVRVLTLDPRNAVANAGMSALNMDENSESRLKNLLREQRDSAALHFALGNIYAGQSRWGEAQSAYFNAYTLDSKNAELAFNLAVSLDHLGQNKLAAQYYQRALQLDPSGQGQPSGLNHAQITLRVQELTR